MSDTKEEEKTNTTNKIKCWFSGEINLLKIDQTNETFTIFAYMNMYWKDKQLFEEIKKTQFEPNDALVQTKDTITLKGEVWDKTFWKLRHITKNMLPIGGKYMFPNEATKRYFDFTLKNVNCKSNWHLFYQLEMSFNEHLELNNFPFDKQFLNVKIGIKDEFQFVDKPMHWIPDQYDNRRLLKVYCGDTVKTQWNLLSTWVDFTAETRAKFEFALIRLRVVRKPLLYIIQGILPLFLIVTVSMFVVFLDATDDLSDKLAYLITVLLTLSAFQFVLKQSIPESPEMTKFDVYILFGYFIVFGMMVESCIVSQINDYDITKRIDWIITIVFFISWVLYSIWLIRSKSEKDEWNKLSEKEYKQFEFEYDNSSQTVNVAGDMDACGGKLNPKFIYTAKDECKCDKTV
eukprot:269518_1